MTICPETWNRTAWLLVGLCASALAQNQANEYNVDAPKTILELQQFRQVNSVRIAAKDGRQGVAALVNLNPNIGAWYLLKVTWAGSSEAAYHIENPRPGTQKLVLDAKGFAVLTSQTRYACDLFNGDVLTQAKSAPQIFEPLCDGRIYLRNAATGHRTSLEAATEFFREHVWGGERIIAWGHDLLGDIHRETGKVEAGRSASEAAKSAPAAALIDPTYCDRLLASNNLGIDLGGPERTGMTPGSWYPANGHAGVYVSVLQPNVIDQSILRNHLNIVNKLDSVEASALVYLIAFDLSRFELGFALGTEHPGVHWSDRALPQARDSKLPGPDGIGSIAPLVSTGMVGPENATRTVATFTAGFKRTHGAFRYGDLALKNHGSHYGFIEEGVVFSKLQPGLATIFVLADGSLHMKTWEQTDDKLLAEIRYARQNGVPLAAFDPATQTTMPGSLVARWGPGNWSGSQDSKLRSIRSGAAIQETSAKRFLIYAVFSDASPSAMARVFQAYRCEYAMLLDMNALEHTYCALYRRSGTRLSIEHVIKGMSEVDKSAPSGELLPRFLAYPDNRDFFYVMRRGEQGVRP